MPKTHIKPTYSAPDQHGDIKVTHPAFAAISAARVSCQPPAHLFGSAIPTNGFMRITISEAAQYTGGVAGDRVHGLGRSYIEIEMTEAQWAAFVSRVNVGSGVPCTLNRLRGEDIPGLDLTNDLERKMSDNAGRMHQRFDEHIKTYAEKVRASAGKMSAKQAEEFERNLGVLVRNLEANLKFGHETLVETAEKAVLEAKIEVSSFIADSVRQLGVQSLGQLAQLAAPTSADDQ